MSKDNGPADISSLHRPTKRLQKKVTSFVTTQAVANVTPNANSILSRRAIFGDVRLLNFSNGTIAQRSHCRSQYSFERIASYTDNWIGCGK
jgi:hypothetical protein